MHGNLDTDVCTILIFLDRTTLKLPAARALGGTRGSRQSVTEGAGQGDAHRDWCIKVRNTFILLDRMQLKLPAALCAELRPGGMSWGAQKSQRTCREWLDAGRSESELCGRCDAEGTGRQEFEGGLTNERCSRRSHAKGM